MLGFSEAQKVQAISKVFADSSKSPMSVVIVDNIEDLMGEQNPRRTNLLPPECADVNSWADWAPVGERFSNAVLQTLRVLMARRPPKVDTDSAP